MPSERYLAGIPRPLPDLSSVVIVLVCLAMVVFNSLWHGLPLDKRDVDTMRPHAFMGEELRPYMFRGSVKGTTVLCYDKWPDLHVCGVQP